MRILVADDHALFRDGIVSLLEASGYEVVGQAGDGVEAVNASKSLEPDLVLMDISLPQLDGLQALRAIKAEMPHIKVVMLTISEEEDDLTEAISSGAHGYLLKSLETDEFLANLAGLARDELAISRQHFSRVVENLVGLVKNPPAPSKDVLTQREVGLLQMVADGLSNKAIAQRLTITENTVKYHMRQILQKTGAHNRTEAVMFAIQAGLIKPGN